MKTTTLSDDLVLQQRVQIILLSRELQLEGLILAAGANWMRVALREQDNPLELRLVSGEWVSDTGETLEIATIFAIPESDTDGVGVARVPSRSHPVTAIKSPRAIAGRMRRFEPAVWYAGRRGRGALSSSRSSEIAGDAHSAIIPQQLTG